MQKGSKALLRIFFKLSNVKISLKKFECFCKKKSRHAWQKTQELSSLCKGFVFAVIFVVCSPFNHHILCWLSFLQQKKSYKSEQTMARKINCFNCLSLSSNDCFLFDCLSTETVTEYLLLALENIKCLQETIVCGRRGKI